MNDACNACPVCARAAALQGAALELLLLGGTTGTWAERVALLFKQLARGCELEAVCIPGEAKGGDGVGGTEEPAPAGKSCMTA